MVGKLSSSSGIIYKVFEALQDITTYSSTSGNTADGMIKKGTIFEGALHSGSWVEIYTIIKGSYSGMSSTIFCKTSIEGQDVIKEKTDMEGSSSAEDATGSTGSFGVAFPNESVDVFGTKSLFSVPFPFGNKLFSFISHFLTITIITQFF